MLEQLSGVFKGNGFVSCWGGEPQGVKGDRAGLEECLRVPGRVPVGVLGRVEVSVCEGARHAAARSGATAEWVGAGACRPLPHS